MTRLRLNRILALVTCAWVAATEMLSAEAPDPSRVSHWSFQPVNRPQPPSVRATSWARNDLDRFILAQLEESSLTPSPPADRTTLIRRLYFVMLGMPPTPTEVETFLADQRPDAFERLVDWVLDDPRYGERWGRHWLDIIRFAESNGFETNRERLNSWRFRDYVIAAFNQDKPYNRFIQEQIAGDALGVDVATGFLVGGPVDIVGSPDPVLTAQQRADELDDMVSTTGTAFLGLTLGCARCHTHKFDPIDQNEYYAMTALLNGVKHGERAAPLATDQKERLAKFDSTIKEREEFLARFIAKPALSPTSTTSLRSAVNALQNEEVLSPVTAQFVRFTILESNASEPCLDELEVWSGDRNVALATNGTKATASGTLPGFEIHQIAHLNDGKVGNSHSWISSEAGRGWVQLQFSKAERIDRIVWGRDRAGQFKDRVATKYRIETAASVETWGLVASSDDREPFNGKVDKPAAPDYRFEGLPAEEVARAKQWITELKEARQEREALSKESMIYAGTFTQGVTAYRLYRGDPMQKREEVAPGTLALFNRVAMSSSAPEQERRLNLSRWISDAKNPLTARVLVNRVWQYQFGVGLVDTPNDFGRNGAAPSHPQLLDWLASQFVDHGWSVKEVQRLILKSAAWQQSSAPRPDALQVDGASRLLWRFPPRRLEAEAIRDSILAVTGSLDRRVGGPSFYLHEVDRENVYHYKPKEEFQPAEFRRMVYAFKVRMEQDGIFGTFDCPDGSLVMPKRSVSTTPLQALNLFNSRFVLQQSEAFATRLQREAGEQTSARIDRAWHLAFNRAPTTKENADAIRFTETYGLPAFCRALLNANEFLFIP